MTWPLPTGFTVTRVLYVSERLTGQNISSLKLYTSYHLDLMVPTIKEPTGQANSNTNCCRPRGRINPYDRLTDLQWTKSTRVGCYLSLSNTIWLDFGCTLEQVGLIEIWRLKICVGCGAMPAFIHLSTLHVSRGQPSLDAELGWNWRRAEVWDGVSTSVISQNCFVWYCSCAVLPICDSGWSEEHELETLTECTMSNVAHLWQWVIARSGVENLNWAHSVHCLVGT